MRKRIKDSLTVKVFLLVFSALTICCMLFYGIVMMVVPRQYRLNYDKQFESNVEALVSDLENMDYEDGVEHIYNFCITNHYSANLYAYNDDGIEEAIVFNQIRKNAVNSATLKIYKLVEFADRRVVSSLYIRSNPELSNGLSELFLKLIFAVLGIILLLSAVIAVICSKVIASPIVEISRISERMTMLDMTWRCEVKSSDEIGILAFNLNTMASRLHSAMDELESVNHQLELDVEHFQRLETERRHFFAAVSHELKTPLTIVKGQIENMMLGYGDYKNHEKYLPETMKSIEDIEMLVREILSVTKMESMNIGDTLKEVSLSDTVDHVVKMLLPLAQEKGILIHQNIAAQKLLSVNPALWEKALSNIIGNAIKHSPDGAKVSVFLQDENVLAIENTGVTIPEENLPYLFTPFYRTDKSRNRSSGGSGLGLYIVGNILKLHGMGYEIKNTDHSVIFQIKIK